MICITYFSRSPRKYFEHAQATDVLIFKHLLHLVAQVYTFVSHLFV